MWCLDVLHVGKQYAQKVCPNVHAHMMCKRRQPAAYGAPWQPGRRRRWCAAAHTARRTLPGAGRPLAAAPGCCSTPQSAPPLSEQAMRVTVTIQVCQSCISACGRAMHATHWLDYVTLLRSAKEADACGNMMLWNSSMGISCHAPSERPRAAFRAVRQLIGS